MTAFYFDVGGVLIPDRLAPDNALNVFRELGKRCDFAPETAHAAYTALQPSLDLGTVSLPELCAAMGVEQKSFERDWLAMHPVDGKAIAVIERLATAGYPVGLATNFCRRLLDLLIRSVEQLAGLHVCCSSDIGVAKPSSRFFDCASKIIDSREVVFVDDRAVNVEAARRYGWTAMLATEGWLSEFEDKYLAGTCSG
jgi:FMN phosphatase YigB (HAD superfamily)